MDRIAVRQAQKRAHVLPEDVVDVDHEALHADLETWGRWNRESRAKLRCGSGEREYRSPWRQWTYPSMSEMMPKGLVNPRNQQIDRAVLRLPDQHRETIRRYYCFQQKPETICRHVHIHHTDFRRWMRDCRNMVRNQLTFQGY